MTITHDKPLEPVEAGKITNMLSKLFNSLDGFLQKLADMDVSKEGPVYRIQFSPEKLPGMIFTLSVTADPSKNEDRSTLKNLDFTLSYDRKNSEVNDSEALNKTLSDLGLSSEYIKRVAEKLNHQSITKSDQKIDVGSYEDDLDISNLGEFIVTVGQELLNGFLGHMGVLDTDSIKIINPTTASVKFELQKVLCDTGYDINLVSIGSATDPNTAFDAISDIVEDDEFISEIPEGEPVPYEVQYDDDTLDVCMLEEYEGVKLKSIIEDILGKVIISYNNISFILYNAIGKDREVICRECENTRWTLREMQDYFSKLAMRLCVIAPHPVAYTAYDTGTDVDLTTAFYSYDEFAKFSAAQLASLVNILDLYYVDFAPEDQARINNFLEELKVKISYMAMPSLDVDGNFPVTV